MTGDSDKDGKGTVKIEEDSSSDTSDMSDDDMPTPSNSSAMLPGAIHQNLHRHTRAIEGFSDTCIQTQSKYVYACSANNNRTQEVSKAYLCRYFCRFHI